MRYIRIFLLQMQTVLQERGRAFIWFLMAAIQPLILILFWEGAAGNKAIIPGWDFASLASYYFFLTIAYSLLVSHIEESIAKEDIKNGHLVAYLTKPFSYFWKKFLEELPYRVLQSSYGFVVCLVFFFIFGKQLFVISKNPIVLLLSIFILILALFISSTMKMIMGIAAFWFIDTRGFFEAIYATEYALNGQLLPLVLLPQAITHFAYALPFAYIIYFPIVAIQGKLSIIELFHIIGMQVLWLGVFGLVYHVLWVKGIKKFSGVGQ